MVINNLGKTKLMNEVELDPWKLFLNAMRAPMTRDRYQTRVSKFFDFSKIPGKTLEQKAKTISQKSEVIEKVNKEVVVNTEEMHLQNKPSAIQGLYNELKENIFSIGQDITLKPKRVYVAFIRKTNFVDVVPRKSDIQLFLNLQKGMLSDPKNMARDISNLGHHGNGDYEIKLSNSNEMGYVTSLIRQSYDKN